MATSTATRWVWETQCVWPYVSISFISTCWFNILLLLTASRRVLHPGHHFNPLLSTQGLNPSDDTTVEILHTWLLGGKKYIWHLTTKSWTTKEDELFATWLQSSSIDGLTTNPPRARYLIKYKNSLIGKHFKLVQQLAVFHLYDQCGSDKHFCLWKASGTLGALLWIPEIWDMDIYLVCWQILNWTEWYLTSPDWSANCYRQLFGSLGSDWSYSNHHQVKTTCPFVSCPWHSVFWTQHIVLNRSVWVLEQNLSWM